MDSIKKLFRASLVHHNVGAKIVTTSPLHTVTKLSFCPKYHFDLTIEHPMNIEVLMVLETFHMNCTKNWNVAHCGKM